MPFPRGSWYLLVQMKANNGMRKVVAFTGGGTGGHVYPGLAVLDTLREISNAELSFYWIGSFRGMERKIVESKSLRYFGIPTGKLRRYFSFQNLIDVFKFGFGIVGALRILLKHRPLLLFSKGGYVSVPAVLAAGILKIPVFSHDSDFDPGLATRINARFSQNIFVAYQQTKLTYFKGDDRVIVSGNPIRRDLATADAEIGLRWIRYDDAVSIPVVLFLGGSLGARQINTLLDGCIDELLESTFVVHQTGIDSGPLKNKHRRYFQAEFFSDELPHILACATIVVCRAGASTIWENAALGKPAVLIPLGKGSSRGDQIRNAEYFRDVGAAKMLPEVAGSAELLDCIHALLQNPERLGAMSQAAHSIGRVKTPDGATTSFIASRLIAQRIAAAIDGGE